MYWQCARINIKELTYCSYILTCICCNFLIWNARMYIKFSAVLFFFSGITYTESTPISTPQNQIAVHTSSITQVDHRKIGSSSGSSGDPHGCFAGSRLSSPPGTPWAQAKGKRCRWAHRLVLAESCPCHQRMPKPDPCYWTALALAELHILVVSTAWMTTNADRLA